MNAQLTLFQPSRLDALWDSFDEEDAPAPEQPSRFALRWYQEQAVEAILSHLEQARSTLLVLPTGMGKTRIFVAAIERWIEQHGGRALVLAHTDELVSQAIDSLQRYTDLRVGREQSNQTEMGEPVVVGSMQTVRSDKRLERFKGFGLVVIDEAHRSECPSYRKIQTTLEDAKVIGCTATPKRQDGKALGATFDSVSYLASILDGISWGYLVPMRSFSVDTRVNISKVKISKGDFAAGELDEKMSTAVEGIVKATLELYPDRKAICFFPGVHCATYAAERFNALKPDSAVVVSGKTPPEERRQIMKDVRRGHYQYLCNCQLFTEGFDWPECSLIVQGRPTKSKGLLTQMVGRGTRVYPGAIEGLDGEAQHDARKAAIAASPKPDLVVLNFVAHAGENELQDLHDVLGGDFDPQEIALAKRKERKKMHQGEASANDVLSALESARAELKALSRSITTSKVEVKATEYDPFKTLGIKRDGRAELTFGAKPPSDRLIASLRDRFRVPEADLKGLSMRQAMQLQNELFNRIRKHLCTYAQAKVMAKWGLPGDLPFDRASAVMQYLVDKRFGRRGEVDPAMLKALANGSGRPEVPRMDPPAALQRGRRGPVLRAD